MRVAGGSARGMPIKTPSRTGVRPTMDRVKTALFNILGQGGVHGKIALDLYAGTGALGIEVLSRGGEHVDFVEADRTQCNDIKSSLLFTKLENRAQVWHMRVDRALVQLPRRYDLVLMDPPYRDPFPIPIMEHLVQLELLRRDAIVVAGHPSRVPAPVSCGELHQWSDRRYGDSSPAFYSLGLDLKSFEVG